MDASVVSKKACSSHAASRGAVRRRAAAVVRTERKQLAPASCPGHRNVLACVGLQSFTFDDDTQFELSFLHAEIGNLSDVRGAVVGKSPEEQVSAHLASPDRRPCRHFKSHQIVVIWYLVSFKLLGACLQVTALRTCHAVKTVLSAHRWGPSCPCRAQHAGCNVC